MTNAEAIEVLRNLEYHTDVKIRDVEAIGLAIEALQYENYMRDKIHHIEESEKPL